MICEIIYVIPVRGSYQVFNKCYLYDYYYYYFYIIILKNVAYII